MPADHVNFARASRRLVLVALAMSAVVVLGLSVLWIAREPSWSGDSVHEAAQRAQKILEDCDPDGLADLASPAEKRTWTQSNPLEALCREWKEGSQARTRVWTRTLPDSAGRLAMLQILEQTQDGRPMGLAINFKWRNGRPIVDWGFALGTGLARQAAGDRFDHLPEGPRDHALLATGFRENADRLAGYGLPMVVVNADSGAVRTWDELAASQDRMQAVKQRRLDEARVRMASP